MLNKDEFEIHTLHVMAHLKFENYGDSLQKLVSTLNIQVLKQSIIYAYEKITE